MRKLLAVLLVAVMATPAFAAVQNVKVSGSVNSSYVNRQNFTFDEAGAPYSQDFFYTAARLRVDADLSDNVAATVALVNELPWGSGASSGSQSTELELANVALREFLYSPLTLVIGRQDINLGNAFILGKGGNSATGALSSIAGNLARTLAYDGIRATLDYKPLTLDLFYFKVNQNNTEGLESAPGALKDDVDLFGVNANYQLGDEMNTVVEGYYIGQISNSASATNGNKADTVYVPGLRVSTSPVKGLTTGVEAAMQFGNKVISGTNQQRDGAWAAQATIDYALPIIEEYKPMLSGRYTYGSRDSDPAASGVNSNNQASRERYTAFDMLYNDQAVGRIWRSMFSYYGSHVAEAGLSVNPIEDVTVKGSWTGIWLSNEFHAGNASGDGNLSLSLPDGNSQTVQYNSNQQFGYEIDGDVTYQYTEDVKFGLTLGYFKPGDTFDGANDEVATQAIASVGVNF